MIDAVTGEREGDVGGSGDSDPREDRERGEGDSAPKLASCANAYSSRSSSTRRNRVASCMCVQKGDVRGWCGWEFLARKKFCANSACDDDVMVEEVCVCVCAVLCEMRNRVCVRNRVYTRHQRRLTVLISRFQASKSSGSSRTAFQSGAMCDRKGGSCGIGFGANESASPSSKPTPDIECANCAGGRLACRATRDRTRRTRE